MLIVGLALAAEHPPCKAPTETTAFVLTMAPGTSITSGFGHTALLVYAPEGGQRSPVYDHGHFDPRDPWFGVQYALGKAEYWGKKRTLKRVKKLYKIVDRPILAQRLDLTRDELAALVADQEAMVEDGNRFIYHWYANNCTTRLRDSLDRAMDGELRQTMASPSGTSVHDLILRHTEQGPMGHALSWGTGARSSTPLSRWDAAFLPKSLHDGLADLTRPDGRPLVDHTCQLQGGGLPWAPETPTSRTGSMTTLGLSMGAGVLLGGAQRHLGRLLAGLFGLLVIAIASVDGLYFLTGGGEPWWTHHNQALANPLAASLVLWALGRRGARPFAWLTVLGATFAAVAMAGLGFPHDNAGAVGFVLPGLWMSALVLERHHRQAVAVGSPGPGVST